MIPRRLEHLRALEGGSAWLDSLPRLVSECAERWSLEPGLPFESGSASLVVPASRDAVLKIQFPHPECRHEAEALRVWDGDGAVRLLAHDPKRHALLLERCQPGSHLSSEGPDSATSVLVGLLPRLWKPVREPFETLQQESRRWSRALPANWDRFGRPYERQLVDAALATLEALATSSNESVLVHQDLHPGNVLRATRRPWLAIDPKPLAGERAFAVAPIVRAAETGHSRKRVLDRLDRLSAELGLDRERARGWAFVQALAWGFNLDGAIPRHVQTARWLWEAG